MGKINKDGVVVYATAPLSGDIEPHIFSKFQKIYFDGWFYNFEMWVDADSHALRAEDAAKYKQLFQSSNLFKYLAQILSNSPRITYLEFTLEVDVTADSKLVLEDLMAENGSEDEDQEDSIENIANEKATELFLDSGIMEPLKTLQNVSSCEFKFGFNYRNTEDEYKPPAKHVRMLKEFKDTIEANFEKTSIQS